MTARTETGIRRTSVATVLFLAAAAAVLSYAGLRQQALDAGLGAVLASLYPLCLDGMTLVGSLGVVSAALLGLRTWYSWLLTLLGVGASVTGNILASPPEIWSQVVHATPPLVLALSLHALMRVYQHQAHLQPAPGEHLLYVADSIPGAPVDPGAPAPTAPRPGGDPDDSPPAQTSQAPRSANPEIPPAAEPALIANPGEDGPAGEEKTKKDRIRQMVINDPDVTVAQVHAALGGDRKYIRGIIRTALVEMGHSAGESSAHAPAGESRPPVTNAADAGIR